MLKQWILCFGLVIGAGVAQAADPAKAMVDAANRFISVLDDEAKAACVFKWEDKNRENWHYLPDKFIKPEGKRFGLRLDKMTVQQRHFAHAMLSTAMSAERYLQASTIMAFEQLLHEMENNNPIRNAEWFYVSIFGEPSLDSSWSWRFEGHHLSINLTLVGGKKITATPSFFAANPGEVMSGSFKGLRLMGDEEDEARKLVTSLDAVQTQKAMLSMGKAPADILTREKRRVPADSFQPVEGIPYKDLNDEQKAQLETLVRVFTNKYRPELLDNIETRGPIADKESMVFGWAGSVKKGKGHYFRVQTKRYLFEYDNVQNGAKHPHAVWREFDGDFGADLLRLHHAAEHGK